MKILTLFFACVCFVSLLLLSATSSLVFAKKEILIPSPVKDAIPLLRCSVCEHTMFQIVRNTLDYIAEYNVKHKLLEERLIDRVLEPVCNPMRTGGNWLRGSDWEIVDGESNQAIFDAHDLKNTKSYSFQFKLRDPSQIPPDSSTSEIDESGDRNSNNGQMNFKCGARCSTAATACDMIVRGVGSSSDDIGGKISSILIKNFPKLLQAVQKEQREDHHQGEVVETFNDPLANVENDGDENLLNPKKGQTTTPEQEMIKIAQTLVLQICRKKPRISGCVSSKDKNNKKKTSKNKIPFSVLHAPTIEEMTQKEVDVEEMMYRMKYGLKDGNRGNNKNKEESTNPGKRYRSSLNDDDDDTMSAGTPGMDVYSRDEMMGLREALQSGDREKLKELDPQSEELSDEEFELLAEMHRKEGFKPQK